MSIFEEFQRSHVCNEKPASYKCKTAIPVLGKILSVLMHTAIYRAVESINIISSWKTTLYRQLNVISAYLMSCVSLGHRRSRFGSPKANLEAYVTLYSSPPNMYI